jgi:AbrB family looped-hinge helix DNA binding protein
MIQLETVMTRKGQVTVPAPIRQALGLKEGDRVAFILEGDQPRLVPRGSVVARTAGALKGSGPTRPLTAEDERAAVERAIAEDVVERMGR